MCARLQWDRSGPGRRGAGAGRAGNLACQLTFLLPGDVQVNLADIAPAPVAPVREGSAYHRIDLAHPTALDELIRATQPAVIFHFGSLLSGSTEAHPALGWEINVNATRRLFDSALAHGVRTVMFPSSLAVHGGKVPDPLPEDHAEWPEGLYGVTKITAERLGHYYRAKHGLDFRCVRLPVIISPFAPAGAASAYASRVFVECARNGRFTFRVPADMRVSTMYVADALRAFLLCLAADPARLSRRVYNLHAISPSAAELAAAACARFPGAAIDFQPDLEVSALIGGWPNVIEDASARADWDWQPAWDLDQLAMDMETRLREIPPS